MNNLLHIETGQVIQRRADPFPIMDGGEYPAGVFVSLEDAEDAKPESVLEGFTIEPFREIDIPGGKIRTRWRVVPVIVGPVKKLTIRDRVSPEEWQALKAMLHAYRGSANQAERETASDWDDATVIDPTDPKTLTVIDGLTGAGILKTTVTRIFETNTAGN